MITLSPPPPSGSSTAVILAWHSTALFSLTSGVNEILVALAMGGPAGPNGSTVAQSLENIARDTERIAWGPDGTARPAPPVTP